MSSLPLIIGHRGASALVPENTLAAFRRALTDGADGIEFDVRLARDGVAVVIHDDTLERTANLNRRVSELTSAELAATNVGNWFTQKKRHALPSAEYEQETVPLLEQVFELFCQHQGLLYLEMKADSGSENELAKEVARAVAASTLRNRIIVECFDLKLIQQVKSLDDRIRTAALFEPKLSQPRSLWRQDLPELAAAHGADEIALHHALATVRMTKRALELGQSVVVWTVDNPDWVSKAKALGIAALITNNPAALVSWRDASQFEA